MQRKIALASLSLVMLTVALMAVMLPPAAAQPGGARLTRTPQAENIPALGAQATLQAAASQLPQTSADIQATLEAAATLVMQSSAEMQATLSAIAQNSAIVVSQDSQSATISYRFAEATVNAVLSASLASAGYPDASADLIAGGLITTIPNVSYNQWTGTLVATYAISAENGSLVVSATSLTIAGHSVPTAAFDSLTESLVSGLSSIIAASVNSAVSYRVDAVVITDTDMTLTMTFAYTGELPQPDITPTFTRRHG